MSSAVVHQVRKRFNFRGSLCMPFGVFMALFVVFPLLIVLYYAFTTVDGNFTFNNWTTVFTNAQKWKSSALPHHCWSNYSIYIDCLSNRLFIRNKKYIRMLFLFYISCTMWINLLSAPLDLRLSQWLYKSVQVWITATHPIIAIIIGMVMTIYHILFTALNKCSKWIKSNWSGSRFGSNPAQVL